MTAVGLGESKQRIVDHLKRHGSGTVPAIAADIGLSVETVRTHLSSLERDGWVGRTGHRRPGPGRPEVVYGLTRAADSLFPSREPELLRSLATYLIERGQKRLVESFFESHAEARRSAAMKRLEGLEGDERLEAVADILSEQGFMARVDADASGRPMLRLSHCPMRGVVGATHAPCAVELRFVRDLLGGQLARVSYIPSGDAACCYALERGEAMPAGADPTGARAAD